MAGDAVPSADPERPTLRVVRGDATPEEIAALVAVLGARSGGIEKRPAAPRPVAGWATPQLRTPLRQGPGAWAASAWR
jgi:hypothetical protein